jgi:glycosyltransferase involved in cell wall biosynthesis
MSRRPIILLLIPHLGGGGAERVTAHLAGGLDPTRFDVHLGLMTQRDAAGYVLPCCVTVHGIGARRVRWGACGLLRLVWRIRPDVILSGMAHLNQLVLLLRPLFPRKTRVVIRQNGCVLADNNLSAYRKLYPKADAVVCQTASMATELARFAGVGQKLRVLPNPVHVDELRAEMYAAPNHWSGPGPHLLAVGRLAQEKGFDLLLHALAKVRTRFPCADLTILGEGREKPVLELLVWVLGLRSAVRLAGHVDQPSDWFSGATLLVLSSRHDAMPNALLEAAAAGLPIVATPASEGVVELLRDQPGVWLTTDTSAEGIAAAIEDALNALEAGRRFSHRWVEAFHQDRAIAGYEALIEEQLAEAAR